MQEITTLNDIVTSLGIPALFFLLFAYALFKLIPEWLKVWKDHQEAEIQREKQSAEGMRKYYDDQREHYNDRQKTYDDQMKILIAVAEQGTEVIRRSNEVIEANTKAIERNMSTHNSVVQALQNDLEGRKEITKLLRDHDERSQKIYTEVLRVGDRVENREK